MKKISLFLILFSVACAQAQNIGINTDGSTPETGVMLDVKTSGTYPKATTQTVQTFFQIKSYNPDADALKLRLGLKTDATAANRYGFIDFADFTSGTPTYRNLSLQPSGGNVGIGTTTPGAPLEVKGGVSDMVIVKSTIANANLIFQPNSTQAGEIKATTGLFIVNANNAGQDLSLQTQGVNTQGVYVKAGGNVGIGTTAAQSLLHLSSATPRINLFDTDAAISAANPCWGVRAQNDGFFRIQSSADYSAFTNRLIIDANGNATVNSLAGTGSVLIQADANGTLSRSVTASGNMVLLYNNETSVSGFTYANTTAFSYNVVGTFSQVKVEADIENDCSGGASTPAVGWSYSIVYNGVVKRTAKLLASSNDDEWLEGHVTYMGAVANGQTVKIDVINVGTAGTWYVPNFRVYGIY